MSNAESGVILVAVDGSQSSIVAAAVGARLARMLQAHLGLVHVLETPPLGFWVGLENRMREDIRAQAERTLTEVAGRIAVACDLTPIFYIVEGSAEQEICGLAKEDPAVLMVVAGRYGISSEKRSRLTQRHSGDLALKLASQLPVPLLLIPPDIGGSHICVDLAELIAQDRDATP